MSLLRRSLLLASAVTLSLATARAAELSAGQSAPAFSLPAEQGGQAVSFSLSDALHKGPVVLYFYPAAFTKGCTAEAHGFADAMPEFSALGASVIGVSMDSKSKVEKFSADEIKGRFPVAFDPEGRVVALYGAKMPDLDIARRVTYVIAPDGKILSTITSDEATSHVTNAINALKAYRAHHPG